MHYACNPREPSYDENPPGAAADLRRQAYREDSAEIRRIAHAYQSGDHTLAYKMASNLDAIVRKQIPATFWHGLRHHRVTHPQRPYEDNPREHQLEMRGRDVFEDGRMIARIEGEGRAYWEGVYTHTDWRIHGVDSHGNARGAGVDTGAEYFKDIRRNLPAVVAKLRRRRNPVEGARFAGGGEATPHGGFASLRFAGARLRLAGAEASPGTMTIRCRSRRGRFGPGMVCRRTGSPETWSRSRA